MPAHRRASSLEKFEQSLTDLFHRARQKEPAVLPDDFWLDVHELVEMVPEDPDGFLAHVFEMGPDDPEWPLEHHAINVGILCILVGRHLRLDEHDLRDLAGGALVHDLGLAPLKRLTEQNRRLTDRERRLISLHAYEGERLFADANKGFDTVQLIVRQSQERENGTGSPEKISTDAIHPLSKIVGACDALESLTHRRPYRPISTPRAAIQKLLDEKEKYASPVLKAMLTCITPYPPGSVVHLSTGVRARVKRVNAGSCLRPVVTPFGPGKHEGIDLDLMHLPHVWIQELKG
ncbi:MAG: HD domain-containing protein [Nitrospirae bacterium]|nr:HD domain-containing protein [Nitrospirota bacterium]